MFVSTNQKQVLPGHWSQDPLLTIDGGDDNFLGHKSSSSSVDDRSQLAVLSLLDRMLDGSHVSRRGGQVERNYFRFLDAQHLMIHGWCGVHTGENTSDGILRSTRLEYCSIGGHDLSINQNI